MSVAKFFKAYDLRATTPELTREVYYWVGFALISQILEPQNLPTKVLVMRDCRLTSPEFYAAFIEGIRAAKGQTLALGIGTTDTLYAASILLNLPAAIITASHNPKDDNGLKIVKEIPQMLGLDSGLSQIRDFVVAKMETEVATINWVEDQTLASFTQENTQVKAQVMDFFVSKIKEIGQTQQTLANLVQIQASSNQKTNPNIDNQFKTESVPEKPALKIVVDTANGMGGFIMPYLEQIYGERVEFVPLFWQLDGSFPNHAADPMNEDNLKDLKAKVLEVEADFGIAMDGDADRAFFVDERGELINGEYIVPMFCQNLLKEYFAGQSTKTSIQDSSQTNKILSLTETSVDKIDIKEEFGSSSNLATIHLNDLQPVIVYLISYGRATGETTLENGGLPVISKQGHTFVKAKMKQHQAIYGGEASGHHYFGQFSFMDSGALTIALFIKIWAQKNLEKLTLASQLCQFWQTRYFVSGERNFRLPEGLSMVKIIEIISQNYPKQDFTISLLDGITVYALDFKFTIRGSNTEPLIRINIETKGQDRTMEILGQIQKLLDLK